MVVAAESSWNELKSSEHCYKTAGVAPGASLPNSIYNRAETPPSRARIETVLI